MAKIYDKPMIQWVCELSAAAVGRFQVFVATDSNEVVELVESLGYSSILTSEACLTGTDRVAEAMRTLGLDQAINVQGDEPLMDPALISEVATELRASKGTVINAAAEVASSHEAEASSLPKVVISQSGLLLYASRSRIPGSKSRDVGAHKILKQVCVYGFNIADLEDFGPSSQKSPLERIEDIEILRFLEAGIPVKMLLTEKISVAVDYPEDIAAVEKILSGTQNA